MYFILPPLLFVFTFHYVSIKTSSFKTFFIYALSFTFHYVSIKTQYWWLHQAAGRKFTFHYVSIKTSNMRKCLKFQMSFTFHYVSIKTQVCPNTVISDKNLHSTMYLLKLPTEIHKNIYTWFTFHYVSIKTIA